MSKKSHGRPAGKSTLWATTLVAIAVCFSAYFLLIENQDYAVTKSAEQEIKAAEVANEVGEQRPLTESTIDAPAIAELQNKLPDEMTPFGTPEHGSAAYLDALDKVQLIEKRGPRKALRRRVVQANWEYLEWLVSSSPDGGLNVSEGMSIPLFDGIDCAIPAGRPSVRRKGDNWIIKSKCAVHGQGRVSSIVLQIDPVKREFLFGLTSGSLTVDYTEINDSYGAVVEFELNRSSHDFSMPTAESDEGDSNDLG